jgi:hypothetical protein
MNLGGQRAKLVGLAKDLINEWDRTRTHWQDARSAEFERRYIEELRARVDKTSSVIQQLDVLLAKVRSDCE